MTLLLLASCVINADRYPRPSELTPRWMVDKRRILAVRAEPPEAGPGSVVQFEVLLGAPGPETEEPAVLWLACPLEESVGGACGGSFPEGDLSDLDPEDLAELGVIGFEPLLPPVYVVPDDALDGLDANERLEGTYVMVQTTVLPPDVLEDPAFVLDPAELEASYKRLVVSEAPTPNHNPDLVGFAVEGVVVAADTVVHVDRGQSYELSAVLSDTSVETYVFVDSEGRREERVEEPYVAWFSTGGEVVEDVTLFPYLQATWTAPARAEEGTWYAVARDRRGGVAWWVQRWVADGP